MKCMGIPDEKLKERNEVALVPPMKAHGTFDKQWNGMYISWKIALFILTETAMEVFLLCFIALLGYKKQRKATKEKFHWCWVLEEIEKLIKIWCGGV